MIYMYMYFTPVQQHVTYTVHVHVYHNDDDDDLIIIKKYCRKGTTYTGLLRCSNMVSFEQGTIHYILSSLGVSL